MKLASGHREKIVQWRRSLHQIPELAYEEVKTSGLIADVLEEMGLRVKEGVGGTGVLALIKGSRPGKVVALRADMDALPLDEKTGLPFASVHKGRMHACGHDSHMAMVLGAARVLKDLESELSGQVKLIFQPAEEQGHTGGAKPLIEAGALENPRVDYIFGMHVWSDLESGKIGYNMGAMLASTDTFYITVKGRGGHGAKPHDAVDPVVAAAHLVVALQTVASREVDPLEPFVLTVGKFQSGTVHNIIPSEAYLEGTIRTVKEGTRKSLRERLERIVAGVTSSFGTDYELRIDEGYPPTVNDPQVTGKAAEILRDALGADSLVEVPPVMGGEDFSRYLERIPGTFLVLGTRNEAKGLTASIHSPHFQVDEDVLPMGSAALAKLALSFSA
ncbi:MAG: M20 family metallopeptidase [Thermoplasmata archaeon]